jgi:carbonic anhydrase
MSDTHIHRRDFLRWGLAGSAGSLLLGAHGCRSTPDCPQPSASPERQVLTMTKDWQDALTPQEIVGMAKAGNQRFLADQRHDRDYHHDQRATAAGQHPAACVLSCIDSRAPAEIILDSGIGDMFNARIAGNFVDRDIAGSMEFACKVAGAKVVMVMGHTGCGAIKGAIDKVQLGNLTALLDRLQPAVAAVTDFPGARTSKNPAYVDAVATANVRLTLDEIRRISPILRSMEAEQQLLLVGTMYDVATGQVTFLD